MFEFKAYNAFIKQLRTDHGWRVEFDVSQDQYDKIKDLPKMEEKIFNIKIEVNETPTSF
jgi:hypothetical protein